MKPTWLDRALENLIFPEKVLAHFVKIYSGNHSSALAKNQDIALYGTELVSKKLDADAARALVVSGRAETLDAILATKDRREGVLDAIVGHWRLSEADQLRFANRALSESMAGTVLNDPSFTPAAKLLASKRATDQDVTAWLYSAELDDEPSPRSR